MFEFQLEETVFYMKDNRVHSAPVLSRICVDNKFKDISNAEQSEAFHKFGESKIDYATIHGVFTEDQIFHFKQDLLDSL